MGFNVVIQSRVGGQGFSAKVGAGGQGSERSFDQDVVTIGRGDSGDVVLEDPQRMVSLRHAEIRRSDTGFTLIDVGSTNGTVLNGQKIPSRQSYPLKDGDQIGIGRSTILFQAQCPVSGGKSAAPLPSSPVPLPASAREPCGEEGREIVSQLREVVRRGAGASSERQVQACEGVLRQAMQGLDRSQAHTLLDSVESCFGAGRSRSASESQGVPAPRLPERSKPVAVSSGGGDVGQAAYEGLVRIAKQYLRDVDSSLSLRDVDLLLQRVERILDVTVSCLADAITGRRQFEREFEVEATRIFSWVPNPIKMAEGGRAIGAYLLDGRQEGASLETMAEALEGVYRDLTFHQLGLVAGFRECLRGLLQQLNPEDFEDEANEASFQVGPFKASALLPGRLHAHAWQRFKDKHRQLTEEEVNVFERVLAPHFAKGYLSIQKNKGPR